MSVLSGKFEEYENVSYEGFDPDTVPSLYPPFQNGFFIIKLLFIFINEK